MKKLLLLALVFLCSAPTYAQSTNKVTYTIIMTPGDSLRKAGNIEGALKAFRASLVQNPTESNTLYNYACLLSVDGQLDSCFRYLDAYLKLDSSTYPLSDPDFIHARADKRWTAFEDRLIRLSELKTGKPFKDVAYAKALWRMHAYDQAHYGDLNTAEKAFGKHSTIASALWDLKEQYNNQNQKELEALVAQKGWPKISDVGNSAASSAFLIIQHADEARQKKYLPTIEGLCKIKEASWESYALMYDRIQTSENKPQRYGSQVRFNKGKGVYELYPLENESKVDEWRKELGMQPLNEYLGYWDISFTSKKN